MKHQHILYAFAIGALLSSCGQQNLDIESPEYGTGKGEELLQSAHLSFTYDPQLSNAIIYHNKKRDYKESGTASFDSFFTITPLYAFKSDNSNYVGDFYIIDATLALASDKMNFGTTTAEYYGYYGVEKFDIKGFYLKSYQVDISLQDQNGNAVTPVFQKAPSPSTTVEATTYTSGVTWNFNAALSGGLKECNLTSSAGFSYDSSRSRTVKDVSITNLSTSSGTVSYKLTINNLPNKKSSSIPEIAQNTFDFHCGWIWQIDNTPENDTDRKFTMLVKIKDLTYGAYGNYSEYYDTFAIPDKSYHISLPVPNRVASGKVVLTNTVNDTYMTDVTFTDANGKVFADNSGSVYGKDKFYTASLPEGTYTLSFKLDGRQYASGDSNPVKVKRAEELPITSGYYVND